MAVEPPEPLTIPPPPKPLEEPEPEPPLLLPFEFPVPDWDPPDPPEVPPDPLARPPPLPEDEPLPEEEPPSLFCELMFPTQPPSAKALTSARETPVTLHGFMVVRPRRLV